MKTVQTMLAEAETEVPRISPDEAKGMLGRADVLFLDVREPAEVAASGKVPGAVAVPRGLVEFRADPASAMHDKAFDRAKTVIAYCASGGRSALVGQDPQGNGLFQRTQSRRLQGLAGGGRRRGKGLIGPGVLTCAFFKPADPVDRLRHFVLLWSAGSARSLCSIGWSIGSARNPR